MLRRLGRSLARRRQLTGEEMTLVDFRDVRDREDVVKGLWSSWSDEVHGGFSACSLTVSEEEGGKAIFKGRISNDVPQDVQRSGFAAIKTDLPYFLQNMDDFDVLVFRVKMDHREYTVNVRPESYIFDDLYQSFLKCDKPNQGKWMSAYLPFENMILTGRGRVKEEQRILDYKVIDDIGISIFQQEGDFCLEIQEIKVASFEAMNLLR